MMQDFNALGLGLHCRSDIANELQLVGLEDKIGSVFATGGHIFGGIESTLKAVAAQFHIFGMRVMTAEADYQTKFPFGVGAPTGDPPFNNTDPGPGAVDAIFLDAGKALAASLFDLLQQGEVGRRGREVAGRARPSVFWLHRDHSVDDTRSPKVRVN